MNAKRWIAIVLSVSVFFFSLLISFTSSIISSFGSDSSGVGGFFDEFWNMSSISGEVLRDGDILSRIAVIEVNGIISEAEVSIFETQGYNHATFMQVLDEIKNDDTVEAIVLVVSSPGGGVYESARIRDKFIEIREERDLPVYVCMGSMAASGGYYISAEADKIYASAETLTGSIGVIFSGLNFSELMEKYGISDSTVKSGDLKDMGSSFRPVTEEDVKVFQELVDSAYDRFLDIVKTGRNLNDADLTEIADGRVFDGAKALELGLVDELGYLDDVIIAISEDYGLEESQVYRYNTSAYTFFNSFGYKANTLVDKLFPGIFASVENSSQYNHPRMMYLFGG